MSVQGDPVDADSIQQFKDRVVGRRISEKTAEKYSKWIRRFEMWRPAGRSPDVGMMIDFDSFLHDEHTDYPWENVRGRSSPASYSYSSRKLAISAIKLWLRLEYDEQVIEQPQNIVQGDPEPFEPTYLSRDDIEEVCSSSASDCDHVGCEAALRLSYDAILRASELVIMSPEDFDLDAGVVNVSATKGSMDATLGLSDRTVSVLREHFDRGVHGEHYNDDHAFLNKYGRAWTPEAWAMHFRRKHHPAGSHSFGRHSPIVHRLQSEEYDFGDVYRRARHSNPQMTSRYARIVDVDIPDWAGD